MKWTAIVVLILLIALMSCTSEGVSVINSSQINLGSTSGNISNGGLICGYQDKIVYRSEADGWRLYLYDGDSQKIISEDIPASINVIDGTIYFANFSEGFQLYRIALNGEFRQALTDYAVTNVNVVDDAIYYTNSDDYFTINKMDINGDNTKVLLNERVGGLVTDGQYLYYTKPVEKGVFDIFRIDLNGENEKRLTEGQYAHFINVVDDYIFYWSVDEHALRRIDKNTLENIILINGNVDYVNAHNGYLYFLYAKDANNIYRADYEGKNMIKLSDFPKDKQDQPSYLPTSIYVIDDNVYYRSFSYQVEMDALSVINLNEKEVPWDYRRD